MNELERVEAAEKALEEIMDKYAVDLVLAEMDDGEDEILFVAVDSIREDIH